MGGEKSAVESEKGERKNGKGKIKLNGSS
jgi:hypothetical protein